MELSIEKEQITLFWKNKSSDLEKTMRLMEGVEYWVLDDNDSVLDTLKKLQIAMQDWNKEQFETRMEEIVFLLSYLKTSSSMYILHWIANNSNLENVVDHILIYCKKNTESKYSHLLLDRILTLKNLNFLPFIFNYGTLQLVEHFELEELIEG